ncbi:autotransporter-associated beta strand repeat-containing protein, partial [Azospirillum sp. TSH7]
MNAPSGTVGTLVSSLIDSGGALSNVTDADSSASTGIALTAVDASNGSWYYTTNGGSNWSSVGAVTNTSALLLKADANTRLFFKANSGYAGTVSDAVTFRAWDQTSGTAGSTADTSTNGGATAFSTVTDAANITVTDDVTPTVTGVTSSTADGTYGVGSTVSIQVTFSENVTVTGTPRLTLETGTTDRTIDYVSGTGTNTLTFTYTVQAGDTSSDLDYQSASALALNGGTIKDAAGNDATLTLPATGSGSSLGGSKALVIDTAPAITSATYNASTNTLAVTGTNIGNGDGIDITKLTLTGEGGNSYTLTSDSSVTSTPSSNSFTITLGSTDQAYVEGLLNKNGGSSQGATTYNLAAATGWDSTLSAAADSTGNGITVSNTQKPAITSVNYNASTGVLTVTGTNLVHQPGATNDIDLSKLTITGQGGSGGAVSLSGAVEITSATGFSVTLTGSDKTNLNALLNKDGTSATDNTTYKIASADDWNSTIYGDISDSTGVGITVSGHNSAPVVSDLNGDTKSWAGVGGTVFLDSFSGSTGIASVSDAENDTANWGNGSLTVQRATGGAWSADMFAFSTIYFVDTPTDATHGTLRYYTQNSGESFASYTNANGVLTITLNSAATTAMVSSLFSGITYRNDTPAGDATIRFTLDDGHGASTTADVTVTTDYIYVTGTGDGSTVDVTDGVGLREAVAIANGQAGTQTIVFGSGLASGSISLGSDLAIGETITFDADAASGLTISGGTITVSSGKTLTLTNGSSDTLTIASKITGSGAVTKTGAGTLTLTGGNDYSGATTVSDGTLTTNGGIGDSSAVTVASGATLELSGAETIGSLAGSGSVTLGGNTLSVGGDNTSTSFDGIVSGTGGLSKSGTGTLTLTGTNSYTGATTVSAGTLELNSSGGTALADSSAVTVASGATLKLSSATETIGDLQDSAGTLALGANALTINQTSNKTFSGAITGTSASSLTLSTNAGSTSLTLSGTSNSSGFAGGITVTNGWLVVSSDSNLGTGTLTLNGGTLRLSATTATIDNAVAIGNNGGTVSVAPSGGNLTLSGAVSGSGTLTKAAGGNLTLSADNSGFSGAFTINAGTVTVSNANALGSTTGGTTVADGAALALSGGITVAENLTLSGSGVSSGGALISASGTNTVSGTVTLNANATVTTTSALTISGVVGGANALTKGGSNTLTLSGDNTYTGATTISAGTLVAGHSNALGTTAGSTTVASGATLAVANGVTLAENLTVSGSG